MTLVHVVENEPLRLMLGTGFPAHCYAKNWGEVRDFIVAALDKRQNPPLRQIWRATSGDIQFLALWNCLCQSPATEFRELV